VPVEVFEAEQTEFRRTIAAVGSLESPGTALVVGEESGVAEAVDVPEGQRVSKRHVLVRLEDTRARAAVTVARARLREAEDQLRRLQELDEANISAEAELDRAEAARDAAAGTLEEAEFRLRKTEIRAPFGGLLGLRQANPGQYLEPGDPVVTLTRTDPLRLRFAVAEAEAPEVATGQEVVGQVGRCGARFEGRVDAVDAAVDPVTRTLRVQARVPNPLAALRPGMSARVRLVVGTVPDAVVVPREALVRQGSRHVVYVLDEEDRAQRRDVTPGQFYMDRVRILSGVVAGDLVVTAGQQKLQPGAPTRPSPWTPTTNPNLTLGQEQGDCVVEAAS
jgi:membrane fusion protein (multidrug efflux system)